MAQITLQNIRKSYGAVEVIKDVSLAIERGEFVVFVGPSGCGKSTLLRMIAGLEDISAGELHIGGDLMNEVEPSDRGIAMVFQSYALYPHMSVADNMSFGLRMQHRPKAEVDAKVKRAAQILQLDHLLDRKPGALSGGQRQRVAIGRAIVRDPQVFLFDEPLSNLDAELRVQMRVEIAGLHRTLGNTMIYVTHDQTEAMTLADRIVVLRAGVIEQVGSPLELYDNPDNAFVAGFIGSPRMNFLPATVTGPRQIEMLGQRFDLGPLQGALRLGETVQAAVRPEHLDGESGQAIQMTVDVVEQLGGTTYLHGRLDGTPVIAERRNRDGRAGQTMDLHLDGNNIRLFDGAGQRLR